MRRFLLLGLLLIAVVAAAAVVTVRLLSGPSTALEEAVRLAPADTARYSWTDWAGVRRELGLRATEGDLDELISQGFDADLTATSGLVDSAPLLSSQMGWSPATIDWELFAQSTTGAVEIVRLADDTDVAALGDRLEGLGFTRPDSPTGVWVGGDEVISRIAAAAGESASPTIQHVALDADRHLVMTSDNAAFLAQVVTSSADPGDPDARGVDDVLATFDQAPLAAAVYTGDQACRELAMGQADQSDQDAADDLVAEAGEVNPLAGFAMGVLPDRSVRVAMAFADDDQARTNADTRARLATGPAPGQGGDFTDRFSLTRAASDGRVVTLDLAPTDGAYVLSDLSNGPVLFATC